MGCYYPGGALRKAWACHDDRVLVDGPAGTGKTTCLLHIANFIARKHSGSRQLLVRQSRTSMTESVLVTFETKVLTPDNPICQGPHRSHRQAYQYPNGSTIVVCGLDNVERTKSTDYDMIYMFESTECELDDLEYLTRALRNFVVPYQQIICDCNPAGPKHWLKVMADEGNITRIPSTHKDNPMLWDGSDWTKKGANYLKTLSQMTGHRRSRLLDGLWVAAEGLVWDWSEDQVVQKLPFETHAIKDRLFDIAGSVTMRFIAVDYGTVNPFTAALYTAYGKKLYISDEFWWDSAKEQRLLSDSEYLAKFNEQYGTYKNTAHVVVDPSAASFITALRNAGWQVSGADNDVDNGIRGVRTLISEGRLLIHGPSCPETIRERQGYVWDVKSGKDKPVKVNDHSCDRDRYGVMHFKSKHGMATLEEINAAIF